MHGHQWRAIVKICFEKTGENGIAWDFTNLKKITKKLDHKCLNDILDFNPTAENLAEYIFNEIRMQNNTFSSLSVRICESPKNWCEYNGEN